MTNKVSSLAFQPAPRPQSRLSAADAAKLAEASADLGFARPLSAAEPAAEAPELPKDAPPATATPRAPRPVRGESRSRRGLAPSAPGEHASLKIDVPDAVWTNLKLEAVRRRVTVKFLVLEALARQGYEIDLASVPEDGRRLR